MSRADAKAGIVQVTGGAGSNQKRFGTLHVFLPMRIKADAPLKLAMIYHGKGKVWEQEKYHYHSEVEVFFNKSAWCTSEFCIDHVDRIIDPWFQGGGSCHKHWIYYMDSLGAQKTKDFIESIHLRKGAAVFGPKRKTENWQPVDVGGIGSALKSMARMKMEAQNS